MITELAFWAIALPIIVFSFHNSNGEWLNIADNADRTKIFAYSAGFTSLARLAVPIRLGIAVLLQPRIASSSFVNNVLNITKEDGTAEI